MFVYRTRPAPALRPLPPEEPEFPWVVLPILSLGFLLFFAGLALIAADPQPWEAAVPAVGVALVAGGLGLLARRFL